MATLQQVMTAKRFSEQLSSMVSNLKTAGSSTPRVINFWNALGDPAKNAICVLESLDRAEIDSVVATLESVATTLGTLPNTSSSL